MSNIEKQINQIIMKYSFLDNEPDKNLKLKDDLGIDSIKIVEFIITLEEEFHIEMDESSLDPSLLITVDDAYKLVNKYISK